MGDLSENFSRHEFACRCCGLDTVSPALIERLEAIRAFFDRPITITSGVRCEAHNAAVGGSAKSQHLLGKAADIRVVGVPDELVQEYCLTTFPTGGIGCYPTFTHVDVREGRARWGEV